MLERFNNNTRRQEITGLQNYELLKIGYFPNLRMLPGLHRGFKTRDFQIAYPLQTTVK